MWAFSIHFITLLAQQCPYIRPLSEILNPREGEKSRNKKGPGLASEVPRKLKEMSGKKRLKTPALSLIKKII